MMSVSLNEFNANADITVLVTNLGTPDAPTNTAVRRYLSEFLSDPRVIELSPFLWKPLLHTIILPFRTKRSVKLYQKIWTPKGSPLRIILEEQTVKLRKKLGARFNIISAMRYGNPALSKILTILLQKKIKKILLFPLYPQYSATSTATTFDLVAEKFRYCRFQPELRTINGYHKEPGYISLIAESIKKSWQENGQTQKLLFSFHGLPKSYCEKGDPYESFCKQTAEDVAKILQLKKSQWNVIFQSRFGQKAWLTPYADKFLRYLPAKGIKNVTVVCPGFSADCLETLEETQQFNRELFLKAGGKNYHYVKALNAEEGHITFLANMIRQHTIGW